MFLIVCMILFIALSENISHAKELNKDIVNKSQNTGTLHLTIVNEGITDISPSAFETSNYFTEIDLSNNFIKTLSNVFEKLTNLIILDLSRNRIESFSEDTFLLSKLRILNLSHNQLKTISEFNLKPAIELINLSNNQLTELNIEIEEGAARVVLDLRNNRLSVTSFHRDMRNILTNIQHVYLCGNQITCSPEISSLPSDICGSSACSDTENVGNETTTFYHQNSTILIQPTSRDIPTTRESMLTTNNQSFHDTATTTILPLPSNPKKRFCLPLQQTLKFGIFKWPRTPESTRQSLKCIGGEAIKFCNQEGKWNMTDFKSCQEESIDRIFRITIARNNASDVAQLVKTLLQNSTGLSAKNVIDSADIVNIIFGIQDSTMSQEVEETISDIIDSLLTIDLDTSTEKGRQTNKKIFNVIDKFTSQLPIKNATKIVSRSQFSIGLINTSQVNTEQYSLSIAGSRSIQQSWLNKEITQDEISIVIPKEVVSKSKSQRLEFRVLTKTKLLAPASNYANEPIVNSFIIMGRGESPVKELTTPVVIRLLKINPVPKNYRLRCAFWDFSSSNWSSQGCKTKETVNSSSTICECDHLTNFALLMDIYDSASAGDDTNSLALSVITYIGLSLSVLGLLITLITYGTFISGLKCCAQTRHIREHRKDIFSKILFFLSLTLLVANVIFLAGSHFTEDNGFCKAIAVLLHYTFMSVMFWSLVQSFYLYMTCVKVLNNSFSKFMVKCSLVAWGCPAVIVAITIAVKLDNYGLHKQLCWIKLFPYYFAFLLPTGLILLANFIIFVIMMYRLFNQYPIKKSFKSEHSSSTYKESSSAVTIENIEKDDKGKSDKGKYEIEKKSIKSVKMTTSRHGLIARIKTAIGLSVLLGLTWILAVFAINGIVGLVFQYLFVIFVSFQGVWIFIFHCAMKEDVRKFWKQILLCYRSDIPSSESKIKKTSNNSKESKNRSKTSRTFDKDSGISIQNQSLSSSSVSCHDVYIYLQKDNSGIVPGDQNQNNSLSKTTCSTFMRNDSCSSINEDDSV